MTGQGDDRGGQHPLLQVEGLRMHIHSSRGVVRAVDDVSLEVWAREAVAIVGESGSGKSMTALTLMRLMPPLGRIVAGRISFLGTDVLALNDRQLRALRGARIAAVFQDPLTFLNPVMNIGEQVEEAIVLHQDVRGRVARERALDALRMVRIPDPERIAKSFPHQISGGMRQRVLIAIAIACKPALLIADEPTTALDVTIQAQIMDLLARLREELRSSLLLITHDLGVVAESCDRVYVMYAGQIVEHGDVFSIFEDPKHPYTQGLLAVNLSADRSVERFSTIEGRVPNLVSPPSGCRFHPRCPYAMDVCRAEAPPVVDLGQGRWARCWLQADVGADQKVGA